MRNMSRVEAYWILNELWDNATENQREAIKIAQYDIEFVDLMPDNMEPVVHCKDCKWRNTLGCIYERTESVPREDNDFCSDGENKDA